MSRKSKAADLPMPTTAGSKATSPPCLALRRAQRIEREVSEAEEARAACAPGSKAADLQIPATAGSKAFFFFFFSLLPSLGLFVLTRAVCAARVTRVERELLIHSLLVVRPPICRCPLRQEVRPLRVVHLGRSTCHAISGQGD